MGGPLGWGGGLDSASALTVVDAADERRDRAELEADSRTHHELALPLVVAQQRGHAARERRDSQREEAEDGRVGAHAPLELLEERQLAALARSRRRDCVRVRHPSHKKSSARRQRRSDRCVVLRSEVIDEVRILTTVQ